jgi:hypothetical protein
MKKRRPIFPPDEKLSQDEQAHRLEDLTLKRADAIRAEREQKLVVSRTTRQQLLAKLKKTRLAKRCRECGAMKYYLKNGKTK